MASCTGGKQREWVISEGEWEPELHDISTAAPWRPDSFSLPASRRASASARARAAASAGAARANAAEPRCASDDSRWEENSLYSPTLGRREGKGQARMRWGDGNCGGGRETNGEGQVAHQEHAPEATSGHRTRMRPSMRHARGCAARRSCTTSTGALHAGHDALCGSHESRHDVQKAGGARQGRT